MKRIFTVVSLAAVLAVTAFAQTSQVSAKKDCCASCCTSKCTDCCSGQCTSDCCNGNCAPDCCQGK